MVGDRHDTDNEQSTVWLSRIYPSIFKRWLYPGTEEAGYPSTDIRNSSSSAIQQIERCTNGLNDPYLRRIAQWVLSIPLRRLASFFEIDSGSSLCKSSFTSDRSIGRFPSRVSDTLRSSSSNRSLSQTIDPVLQ